jgi:soluble lytic murein transglycosylase-like protein
MFRKPSAAAFCLVLAGTAAGQSTPSQDQSRSTQVRSAMEASIRRQKESVQRQIVQQESRQRPKQGVAPAVRATPSPVTFFAPECTISAPEDLQQQIEQAAVEQGVAAGLLRAVAHAESGFQPCAMSPKGAQGLMQIMPATARDLGLVDPWDPQQSLAAGAKYLRQLLDRYDGDVRLALGAYNAGPARVDRTGGVPPILETQDYVRRILSEFNQSKILDIGDPAAIE